MVQACLVALLPGQLDAGAVRAAFVAAHAAGAQVVHVYLPGFTAKAPTSTLFELLGQLYSVAGDVHPCLDVRPLLPFAGWSAEAVAALPGLTSWVPVGEPQQQAEQQGVVQGLDTLRPGGPGAHLQPCTALPQPAATPAAAAAAGTPSGGSPPAVPPQPEGAGQQAMLATSGQGEEALGFDRVAVGGTFDRLHAGHRLLLAATALAAQHAVYAGVTADALLAGKANVELLQPYEARAGAAAAFMAAVRPGLSVATGALRDPREPTQAELDPGMQALVVSAETLRGGEAINQGRAGRGLAPLRLLVVGLVGGRDAASKLSSTALRAADARALAAGAGAVGSGAG